MYISIIHHVIMEADGELLDEIAKELGLKDRLKEILRLSAQECRGNNGTPEGDDYPPDLITR